MLGAIQDKLIWKTLFVKRWNFHMSQFRLTQTLPSCFLSQLSKSVDEDAKHHLAVGWHGAKLFVQDHNPCWTPVIQTCLGADGVFSDVDFVPLFLTLALNWWLVLIGGDVAPWCSPSYTFLWQFRCHLSNVLCFVHQINNEAEQAVVGWSHCWWAE